MNNNISKPDLEELKKQYQEKDLDIVLNKIENGYPVQYAIGYVNFCGNKLMVNENVLIPRYETEFLVELIKKTIDSSFTGNIFDIGTGSGAIAISLGKIFSKSKIDGIDISKEAILVAENNKNINKVTNVSFFEKDINNVDNFDNYDVIVSNPPYVDIKEEVGKETKYEPQNAIFATDNGLFFYKKILSILKKTENKPTYIFFEIGMNQAEYIKEIFENLELDYTFNVKTDLSGKNRYVYLIMNK